MAVKYGASPAELCSKHLFVRGARGGGASWQGGQEGGGGCLLTRQCAGPNMASILNNRVIKSTWTRNLTRWAPWIFVMLSIAQTQHLTEYFIFVLSAIKYFIPPLPRVAGWAGRLYPPSRPSQDSELARPSAQVPTAMVPGTPLIKIANEQRASWSSWLTGRLKGAQWMFAYSLTI